MPLSTHKSKYPIIGRIPSKANIWRFLLKQHRRGLSVLLEVCTILYWRVKEERLLQQVLRELTTHDDSCLRPIWNVLLTVLSFSLTASHNYVTHNDVVTPSIRQSDVVRHCWSQCDLHRFSFSTVLPYWLCVQTNISLGRKASSSQATHLLPNWLGVLLKDTTCSRSPNRNYLIPIASVTLLPTRPRAFT